MKESIIYPGEYIPLQVSDLFPERILPGNSAGVIAPTNLVEKNDSYEVEIAFPGVKKEDIIVRAQNQLLAVEVPPKSPVAAEIFRVQMHGFEKENLARKIL